MPVANLQSLSKKLKDIGLSEKENKSGYFTAPKSAIGKEFIIYLPEQYDKKDRVSYLKDSLASSLKDFKPKYVSGTTAKSTAGQLSFQGSQVYVIAKLIAAKGGGGNKGIEFEKKLEKDLNTFKNEKTGFMYEDFMHEFANDYLKGDSILKVEDTGKKNTPRPLAISGKELYVSVRGGQKNEKIGSALADLIIHTKKKKKINLSLKYGNTVTFFNSGITKAFTMDAFKKGKFETPVGKAIVNMFGIDEKRFANVFLKYKGQGPEKEKVAKKIETVKVDKTKLHDFIKTVIGYDYLLIHLNSNGTVDTYNMTKQKLETASMPMGNTVEIHYPLGGAAKRIDIKVETKMFHLNFNIRNKQGGVLPSHIMCDYKIKH